MTTELPYSLMVDGVDYPIATDFRDVLDIFAAFNSDNLSPLNKQFAMLEMLYSRAYKDENGEIVYEINIPPNQDEAARMAVWFLDGGDIVKSDSPPSKTMDYEQDAPLLFSAVNRIAGFEVRNPDVSVHWFTFLGYCAEIHQDSPISHIVHLRHKLAKGEKLEKYEQKFYRENRHLIDFR